MFELLQILWKWRKAILIACAVATVGSIIISLLLPNQYKSTAILRPISPTLLDRAAIFPKEGSKNEVYLFGGKDDIDRLLSIGGSGALYGYLIQKHHLYAHYGIDSTAKEAEFKVMKKLTNNYEILKNTYNEVEVQVTDKDPVFAAQFANDITNKIDEINRGIIFEKKNDILKTLQVQHNRLQQEVKTLSDSTRRLIAENPRDTISSGVLYKMLQSKLKEFGGVKENLEESQAVQQMNMSTIYITEKATVASRKFKPQRSLLVLGTLLITFVLGAMAAVFTEKYKEYQQQNGISQ